MKKNNIIFLPSTVNAEINHLIAVNELAIAKYKYDMKKMNWFTAGLMTGMIASSFIFSCVYYFLSV